MGSRALSGYRVLDLTQQLPGPYATHLLAAIGADVIKVEPPKGDPAREIDPAMFERVNAGKRSVVLDLKTEEGQAALRRLVETSDVLVEGFRPGTVERLGADHEAVRELRPDIVYCSLSGWGSSGPYRDLPGHDLNYLGVAGGAEGHGEVGRIGVPFVDLGSGTGAALAIVAALLERASTGEGRRLDLAMLDTALAWTTAKAPPEGGAEPAYGVFRAADGLRLSVAVLEDKFWCGLCRCLGWEDWLEAGDLATHAGRRRRAEEIAARLRRAIAASPRAELLERLRAADVPAAPVHAPDEAGRDPQVRAREAVAAGVAELAPAPRLGQHGDELLADLPNWL